MKQGTQSCYSGKTQRDGMGREVGVGKLGNDPLAPWLIWQIDVLPSLCLPDPAGGAVVGKQSPVPAGLI